MKIAWMRELWDLRLKEMLRHFLFYCIFSLIILKVRHPQGRKSLFWESKIKLSSLLVYCTSPSAAFHLLINKKSHSKLGEPSAVIEDSMLDIICGRNTSVSSCGCEPGQFGAPNELTCECDWHSNIRRNLTLRQRSRCYSITDVGVCSSEKICSCWKGRGGRGDGTGQKKEKCKLVVQHSICASRLRRSDQYVRHWFNQHSLRKQLILFSFFNVMTRPWCKITYWRCENTCCSTVLASE